MNVRLAVKKRVCNVVAVRSLIASDFIRMATLGLLPDVALAPAGPENMAPWPCVLLWQSGLGECAPCQHLSESLLPDLSVFCPCYPDPHRTGHSVHPSHWGKVCLAFPFCKMGHHARFLFQKRGP